MDTSPTPAADTVDSPPAGLVIGYAFAGIGLIVMLTALCMSYTVEHRDVVSPYQITQVASAALMHNREMAVLFGGFLFVGGTVLLAANSKP